MFDNGTYMGIGTTSPAYLLHVNASGSGTPIYSYREVSSTTEAAVRGVSGTRNWGYLGGEMGTSTEPISNFNFGVYGRITNDGWGGFGGMFYNSSGNWAALAGDAGIGYNYAGYFNGSVAITGGIYASSSFGTSGQVLTSTGTGIQWTTPSGGGSSYWDLNTGYTPNRIYNATYDLWLQSSSGDPTRKIYFGDGSFVWVGEGGVDDRLELHGSTLAIYAGYSTGYGTSGQVLTSDGTTAYWATPSGGSGGVSGSGTVNYIPKFTAASTVGNSRMIDDGTRLLMGTTATDRTDVLRVEGAVASPNAVGYFRNNYTTSSDAYGVYGYSKPADYWGYGGYFEGGWYAQQTGQVISRVEMSISVMA
jgi:hypothetical protein